MNLKIPKEELLALGFKEEDIQLGPLGLGFKILDLGKERKDLQGELKFLEVYGEDDFKLQQTLNDVSSITSEINQLRALSALYTQEDLSPKTLGRLIKSLQDDIDEAIIYRNYADSFELEAAIEEDIQQKSGALDVLIKLNELRNEEDARGMAKVKTEEQKVDMLQEMILNMPLSELAELDYKVFNKMQKAEMYQELQSRELGLSEGELTKVVYDVDYLWLKDSSDNPLHRVDMICCVGDALENKEITVDTLDKADTWDVLDCIYGDREWSELSQKQEEEQQV